MEMNINKITRPTILTSSLVFSTKMTIEMGMLTTKNIINGLKFFKLGENSRLRSSETSFNEVK